MSRSVRALAHRPFNTKLKMCLFLCSRWGRRISDSKLPVCCFFLSHFFLSLPVANRRIECNYFRLVQVCCAVADEKQSFHLIKLILCINFPAEAQPILFVSRLQSWSFGMNHKSCRLFLCAIPNWRKKGNHCRYRWCVRRHPWVACTRTKMFMRFALYPFSIPNAKKNKWKGMYV